MSTDLTQQQLDYIKENSGKMSVNKMSEELQLNSYIVRKKIEQLGLKTKKHEWTEEELDYLKENWKTMTFNKLSTNLNISINTIKAKAKELNLEDVPRGYRWTEEEIEYLEKNWKSKTLKDISKELNINTRTIKKKAEQLGLETISKGHEWTEEEIKYIKENSGKMSINKMSENLQLSSYIVRNKIEQLGLEVIKHYKKHEWTEEEIKYIKENSDKMPATKISEELQLSSHIVRNKIEQLGLETISKGHEWTEEELDYIKENWGKVTIAKMIEELQLSRYFVEKGAEELGLEIIKHYKKHEWTEEELDYLKENWKTMNFNELSTNLNISINTIKAKAKELNLEDVPRGYRWTEEEIEYLEKNWKSKTLKDISKNLNINVSTIKKKVEELGLDTKKHEWTEEELDYLKEKYLTLSVRKIAQNLNISVYLVSKQLKAMGFQIQCVERKHEWTKEEIKYLKENWMKLSTTEICRDLKMSRKLVLKEAELLNLPKVKRKVKWTKKKIDKLRDLAKTMTVLELAEYFNSTDIMIRRIISDNNIEYKKIREWTEEDIKILKELAKTMTAQQISHEMGKSVAAIYKKLRRANITIKNRNNFWHAEDDEQLKQLVFEKKSLLEIVKIMDKSDAFILNKAKKLGLKIELDEERKWTEEEIKRLIELSKTMKLNELVLELGRSSKDIKKECKILNIKVIMQRARLTEEEIELIKQLAIVEKKSVKEIASILKRSEATINRKMLNLKIKPINKSKWTKEEEDILIELWGYKSIEFIANKLNRTLSSIRSKVHLMGLDSFYNSNYNVLRIKDICELFDVSRETVCLEWAVLGLKLKNTKVSNIKRYSCVEIEDLFDFLQQHQDIFDSRKLEKNILGEEPVWLQEKRKKDIENPPDKSEIRTKTKTLLIEARNYYESQKNSVQSIDESDIEEKGFRKKFEI